MEVAALLAPALLKKNLDSKERKQKKVFVPIASQGVCRCKQALSPLKSQTRWKGEQRNRDETSSALEEAPAGKPIEDVSECGGPTSLAGSEWRRVAFGPGSEA